jgi:hypothetical protein
MARAGHEGRLMNIVKIGVEPREFLPRAPIPQGEFPANVRGYQRIIGKDFHDRAARREAVAHLLLFVVVNVNARRLARDIRAFDYYNQGLISVEAEAPRVARPGVKQPAR